jgi:hypothetical protein
MFKYYKKRFYVLLDNFELVRMDLDEGTKKMENLKIYLLNESDIEDEL